jgi:hypothetical protein
MPRFVGEAPTDAFERYASLFARLRASLVRRQQRAEQERIEST